jgi:hypothetical protein
MDRAVTRGSLPHGREMQRHTSATPGFGGEARFEYGRLFGFGIPSVETVAALSPIHSFVEIGAGCGFWSYWLRRAGCDVIATDIDPPGPVSTRAWVPDVLRLDAETAVQSFPQRAVLLVWPHFTCDWPAHAVEALPRRTTLCYVGEGPGGCCASPTFFAALDRRGFALASLQRSPSWPNVTDYLAIYV